MAFSLKLFFRGQFSFTLATVFPMYDFSKTISISEFLYHNKWMIIVKDTIELKPPKYQLNRYRKLGMGKERFPTVKIHSTLVLGQILDRHILDRTKPRQDIS